MPAVTDYLNHLKVNYSKRQRLARVVNGLSLIMAIVLHVVLALFLLRSIKIEPIKQPVFMEVKMLSAPTTHNQPMDKAEPVNKNKPVIPKPIEKKPQTVSIKKPVVMIPPTPKPSQEITESIPVVKTEPQSELVAKEQKAIIPSIEPITKNTGSNIQTHDADEKSVISGIMPLVKVNPIYPNRAASRGIEGWVRIEFTILADGSVKDAVVVQSMPEAVFDEAALAAIEQWQFKPKMVNGVAVSQRAAQQLQFKLDR